MAGKIPQHFIDDLLSRVDVVEVIDARVTLKKTGRDYMACCPFHNEKTPSFSVSQPKQFYHCFGCGVNGNAIGFLMEYEGMHFVDAIEALAESVGLEVPRDEQAAQRRDETKPLFATLEKVTRFYRESLRDAPAAKAYLKGRGLSSETAKRFSIGYAPDGWDALQTALAGEERQLLTTGMLIPGKGGAGTATGRPYQRFRDRVMFPIRDRRGRVIAFGGRVLGDTEPKYLNSPETPLFHKSRELYGLFEARRSAQELGAVIVVEGYMDVVALAEHGIENCVATLGTAANREHSEILFRTVPNIVFCFDGDRAGRAAAARAMLATLPCLEDGRDAHFMFLPDGEDPDSIVKAGGSTGFQKLLASRLTVIDFLYEHLCAEIDVNSIGGKAQLAERAKPLLATIPRGVYRQLAVARLEELIGLSLGRERATAAPIPQTPRQRTKVEGGLDPMSRAALLVLQYPPVVGSQSPEDIEIDEGLRGASVLHRLIGYCDQNPSITTARLLERFRDTTDYTYLADLATRQYLPDGVELDTETALADFAHALDLLKKLSRQMSAERKAPLESRRGLLGRKRS